MGSRSCGILRPVAWQLWVQLLHSLSRQSHKVCWAGLIASHYKKEVNSAWQRGLEKLSFKAGHVTLLLLDTTDSSAFQPSHFSRVWRDQTEGCSILAGWSEVVRFVSDNVYGQLQEKAAGWVHGRLAQSRTALAWPSQVRSPCDLPLAMSLWLDEKDTRRRRVLSTPKHFPDFHSVNFPG